MCLSVGVMLTACGDEEHTHTYKTEWSKDATHHWHACEGEDCTDVADKAEHTWNDGEITTKATAEADGVKTFTCTVCGQTKTETASYVMDCTIADRVYSLLGDEENGIISVSLNKDGLFLAITSHNMDLSPENKDKPYADIISFEYDDNGKMTSVIESGDAYAITEYDDNNSPTKTVWEKIYFSYNNSEMTLSIDGEHYTFDEYGRLIGFKQAYSSYTNEYIVTFDGDVGKWVEVGAEDEAFYFVTYENNKRLAKLEEWYGLESCSYCAEYKYSDTGLPTEVSFIEEPLDPESSEGYIFSYEYDSADRVIKMVKYEVAGETKIKTGEEQYVYDTKGNLIEEKSFDSEGNADGGVVYEYDGNGNLLKRSTTYSSGSKYIQEYAYDANGNVTKNVSTRYDSGENITGKDEYRHEYHSNGIRSKYIYISYMSSGNKKYEEITEYRENGSRSKYIYISYTDGVETDRTETLFDEAGNVIQ